MAVKREVLVELVHVKGLHVADDVGAELGDVHVTEVDVLPAAVDEAATFVFQILLHAVVKVRFRGRGRCGGAVGLPCHKKTSNLTSHEMLGRKMVLINNSQWRKPHIHFVYGVFVSFKDRPACSAWW